MTFLITADRWLHRIMRGRCWNRQACERLSCYAAMKDRNPGSTPRTGGPS